jgi:short-chain fatty acids transporter
MTTKPNQATPTNKAGSAAESGLARFGLALANWSERWFPDPLIFAFAGVIAVFLFGLLIHQPASKLAIAGARASGR